MRFRDNKYEQENRDEVHFEYLCKNSLNGASVMQLNESIYEEGDIRWGCDAKKLVRKTLTSLK